MSGHQKISSDELVMWKKSNNYFFWMWGTGVVKEYPGAKFLITSMIITVLYHNIIVALNNRFLIVVIDGPKV